MTLVAKHTGLAYSTFRGTTESVIPWIDFAVNKREIAGLSARLMRSSCGAPHDLYLFKHQKLTRIDMQEEKNPGEKTFNRASLGLFDTMRNRRICPRNKDSHLTVPLIFKVGKK